MQITRNPVKSSNVKSVGYDEKSQTLAVEFAGGGVYHYSGVGAKDYAAMGKAESIGKHIAAHIRPKFKATPWPPKKTS
jgi:hypothetical protein